MINEVTEFYAQAGVMTDPGLYAFMLDGLPTDLRSLCRVVQGNLIHVFWAERYGVDLTDAQKQTAEVRQVSHKLARMWELDNSPLSTIRLKEKRQGGNCRDFSTLLCAILRYQGVPARARCGFGAYFLPNHYEDHWICEYWKVAEKRWVMVDAQLDAFQCEALEIQFDPLDVPHDQFILGGHAWQMCRMGKADPDQFGIFDMRGMWFIWGDVVRDFLALNKVEILPWDGGWGYLTMGLNDPLPSEMEMAFYDRIPALTLVGDDGFEELRRTYTTDDGWYPPQEIVSGSIVEKG